MESELLAYRLNQAVIAQRDRNLGPWGLIDRLDDIFDGIVETVPLEDAIATVENFWKTTVVPIPWGIPGEAIAEAVALKLLERLIRRIYAKRS